MLIYHKTGVQEGVRLFSPSHSSQAVERSHSDEAVLRVHTTDQVPTLVSSKGAHHPFWRGSLSTGDKATVGLPELASLTRISLGSMNQNSTELSTMAWALVSLGFHT
jgi:hypothetical protein